MDCGGVFVKYVLFIFNILFVICGLLLITFGSLMVSQIKDFTSIEETFDANSVAITILALGCIIFLVSFLGCCGAIRENSCALYTYSIVMLVLFLSQLALIVYVWINHDEIKETLDRIVQIAWKKLKSDEELMNTLQKSLKCCGLESYLDYGIRTKYPASCCDAPTDNTCSEADVMLRHGCKEAVDDFCNKSVDIIKYGGIGVTVVELVLFIFAFCLANQTRSDRRRQYY